MASNVEKTCRQARPEQWDSPVGPLAAGRIAVARITRAVVLLVVAIVALGISEMHAPSARGQSPEESDQQREYNIKLAYVCSFARYVTVLPDAADKGDDGVWIIGVLGKDPFGDALDRLAARKRKIAGRTIVARHFASLDDYKRCNVLFIPKTIPRKQQEGAIQAMRGKPVLVVGEVSNFIALGGCVNFFLDEDSVRFEIDRNALKQQHLEASSKLLTLAKVTKEP
jgi:hypothetical protein